MNLDNVVILGSNSTIYKSLKPTLLNHFPSLIEIDRTSSKFDKKQARYLIINFAAPTSDAGNFTNSFSGVSHYLNYLESILMNNSKSIVLHISSYAEFVSKLNFQKEGRVKSNALKSYEFQTLIEQPYTFWKLYQRKMISEITSSYSVATFELTIPFVNFERRNKFTILFEGWRKYFPLNAKVPCISVNDMSSAMVALFEMGTWRHPKVQQISCSALLGKGNSFENKSYTSAIKLSLFWFLTYIFYREINRRNRVRERLIRLVG